MPRHPLRATVSHHEGAVHLAPQFQINRGGPDCHRPMGDLVQHPTTASGFENENAPTGLPISRLSCAETGGSFQSFWPKEVSDKLMESSDVNRLRIGGAEC